MTALPFPHHALRTFATFILCLFALAGCGGGTSDTPAATATGSVSGTVLSAADGSALAGVAVTAGGQSATTSSSGRYTLSNVGVGSAVVLKFALAGYAPSYRSVAVADGKTTSSSARLTPVAATQSVAAATGGTVTVAGSPAQVTLPANGFVSKATGAAYSGAVTVQLTPINPATDAGNMPGSFAARGSDGSAQTIESFGALDVGLADGAGNRLDLAGGQTATLRIPLASRSTAPPATIPLYYFDEAAGLWVQQGTATLAGTAPNQYYEGTVAHFTTWNADRPADSIYVHGCVKDAGGAPAAGAEVTTDGVDYSGAATATADSNGNFVVPIRKGGIADLFAQTSTAISNILVVGPSEVDIFLPACLVTGPPGPPVIVEQPASVATDEGGFAIFRVLAIGAQPLRYQWQRNGVPLSGEVASVLYRPIVSVADNGARFTVVVTNDYGSATSDAAVLTVSAQPPGILSGPLDTAVTVGATATFSVTTLQPAALLSFQWQRNGTAIAGATGPSYTTPATTLANNGDLYSVTLTNGTGSVTSRQALLTVQVAAPPTITAQPANASVATGRSAVFSVTAAGSPPLTYQWKKNGSVIAGATASTYTTPATVLADNGALFTVVVGNAFGSVTSDPATLAVADAALAPTITSQPLSTSVLAGLTATFDVVATGTTPLSYQWKRNGADIAGATAASYTTPVLAVADSGAVFTVAVSNGAGSVTSNGATLTVTPVVTGAGRYLVAAAGPATVTPIVYANGSQSVDSQALLAAPAAAATSASVVEPAGTASALFGQVLAGTVAGGQVTGLHTRYALYFKAGRLYQIDHEVATGLPHGVPLSTLAPSDVCALGGTGEPDVADTAASDLVDATRNWVFFAAPVSGVCASPSNSYRAVRMNMGATDVAPTVGQPVASLIDASGAVTGYILRNGSTFQKVDADLAHPTTLFTLAPSAFRSFGVAFGATAPGIWVFVNSGQLYAYNLATGAGAPTVLATLGAGEQVGSLVSDGANAYVSLTSGGFATPAFRILGVSEALAGTTLHTGTGLLTGFTLTPTRIVMVSSSFGASVSTQVTAVLRDGTGLLDIGGPNAGFLTALAYASGENVYLQENGIDGAGNLTGVRTRVLASDGSNVLTLDNTAIVGVTRAASVPLARNFASGAYAVLLVDNAAADGTVSGGTLRSLVGATRAPLLSYGTVQATPAGTFFPATIDPLQYGLSGLFSFTAGAGSSDLYFVDSASAGSLTKLTAFVTAAGRASPATVRTPGTHRKRNGS